MPPVPGDPAPERDDDSTLFIAQRVQEGRQQAWSRLAAKIDEFLGRTRNVRQLPSAYEPDDYVQEVLLKLTVEIPRMELRSRKEFWAFVRRVADNVLRDLQRLVLADKRGGGRERLLDTANPHGMDLQDPASWSASAEFRGREIEQLEEECVGALGRDEARQVYLLRRRQGLSYEQIAEKVGRNKPGTVKVIYKRSRDVVIARLRDRLDGYATGLANLD
ncbi:MAG: RNA polymerase sigma factor [Planctomycetota bacterium]|jgi:RNA polymerase sigma factor (sigma-70 family)